MEIPNAFIHTCIDDDKDMVIINIRGVLVDILLEIVPDIYGPYVITDRKGGKKLMFQYQNAIYGTLAESLLYFKNFRKSLRGPCGP